MNEPEPLKQADHRIFDPKVSEWRADRKRMLRKLFDIIIILGGLWLVMFGIVFFPMFKKLIFG